MIKKFGIALTFIVCCFVYLKIKSPNQQINSTNTYISGNSIFANVYEGVDSPRENMKFSSKNTVEKLKMIYDKIEFYDGFNEGDLNVYEYYAEKYTQLLKGEVKYYNSEEKTYYDIYHYNPESLMQGNSINCYMFDMDEDGTPELCLSGAAGAYIFKYIPKINQCVLWWEHGGGNIWVMGSRRISQHGLDGSYHFVQLSKSGEKEYDIFMGEYATHGSDHVYLVSLPVYKEGFRENDIIEEMRNEGYYDSWADIDGFTRCYFRVTEKEYFEVTESYWKALEGVIEDEEAFIFKPWLSW